LPALSAAPSFDANSTTAAKSTPRPSLQTLRTKTDFESISTSFGDVAYLAGLDSLMSYKIHHVDEFEAIHGDSNLWMELPMEFAWAWAAVQRWDSGEERPRPLSLCHGTQSSLLRVEGDEDFFIKVDRELELV
jgi:hypothetical protein